jgi:ArsR family transcriptional regulator, arsenate/arsenite/antimonite-responsive transcriptional repressor
MKSLKTPPIFCCPPLLAGRLTETEANSAATLFRVLGEPARLQLLSLIAAQPSKEVCACELVESLGLSQPTVSHHLKVMYEAGLLSKERRGTWIYYRIVQAQLVSLREVLAQIPNIAGVAEFRADIATATDAAQKLLEQEQ